MLHSLTTPTVADQALAWLLTYALHSTLLLALAWGVTHRLGGRRLRLQETIWRCALLGALVTAPAQLALGRLGHAPIAGHWTLAAGGAPADGPASLPPADAPASGHASATSMPAPAPGTSAAAGTAMPRSGMLASPAAAGRGAGLAWRERALSRAWTPLRPWLLPAWLLGALALTLGYGRSYLALRRRLRYRPQVVGGSVLARLASLVRQSGLTRRVRLTCTWRLRVPVALGLRVAEVCVPPRALFQLDDEQQDALLAHELAHLARRDPVWLPLTQLVVAVFFFQPLNWLARRRLGELSELLSDEWAVAHTGRPLSLAGCLAEVAGWSLGRRGVHQAVRRPGRLPVPGMAAGRPSQLAHRIRRLLDGAPAAATMQVTPLTPVAGHGPARRRLAILAAVPTVLLAVTLAAPGVSAGSSSAPVAASTASTAQAAPSAASAAPAAASTPAATAVAGSAPPTASSAAPPKSAADRGQEAEREPLAAAAARLERLDKLGTLSREQIEAITASVERISREIDGRLGEQLEQLNHQLAGSRATMPRLADLPVAEMAEMGAELAAMTAQLHPSAPEMAAIDAELRQLAAEQPHLSAEEIEHVQDEAMRGLRQLPHMGLSQAEIDHLHAEVKRALEEMPKLHLSQADLDRLRGEMQRALDDSTAARSQAMSPAEREKLVADARRLADQVRPDQAQLEALRGRMLHEHEELTRALAEQRAEIEAMRRELRE